MNTNDTEKMKNKNSPSSIRRYWYFVIPLTIFLLLMVKFPLRILVREKFADALFYGAISLGCIALSVHLYRRFRKMASRLILITLLCSVLSGWQIFDLYYLRTSIGLLTWGSEGYFSFESEYQGLAFYGLRFSHQNGCAPGLEEFYWGRPELAITIKIDRNAIWYACGG